jgi:hypothetical protein
MNQEHTTPYRCILIIACAALLGLLALVSGLLPTVEAATNEVVALYDGSAGNGTQTPDEQGFTYVATSPPFSFPLNPPDAAKQSATGGVTTLDTTGAEDDYAGYTAEASLMPALDRTMGYTITLTVQVVSEAHSSQDRAGFSIIVLSSDVKGIELGFWENEIWSQHDGQDAPLFTRDPGVMFDTTAQPVTYALVVKDDIYTLRADGVTILEGELRDYSNADPLLPGVNPYATDNLVFLGDNTTSAAAEIRLASVTVTVPGEEPEIPPGEEPEIPPGEEPEIPPEETPSPSVFLPLVTAAS